MTRPTDSPFLTYVRQYSGQNVYFYRNPGNLGDQLIEVGAESVLESIDCNLVSDPQDADFFLVNGGGCFNSFYCGAMDAALDLRRKFPRIPLVVGPQTYTFHPDMISRFYHLVDYGSAPLALFARERKSLDILQAQLHGREAAVTIGLSQDLALELDGSEWLADRRCGCSSDHVLVSFRSDKESPFPLIRHISAWQASLEWRQRGRIPIWVAKALRRAAQLQHFPAGRKIVRIHGPETLGESPWLRIDATAKGSFNEFLRRVERASLIVTDRLHVGIYAYLLRKPVVLVIGGHYHKIAEVYAMSLSGSDSPVTLCDTHGAYLQTAA